MSLFPGKKELVVADHHNHKLEAPVKKPVHEAAVDFAQAVVELQQAKAATEVALAATEAKLTHALAENKALGKALEDAKSDLYFYHHRVVEIETKMTILAHIITDVMRTSPVHPEDRPEAEIADARAAIEAALSEVSPPPPQTPMEELHAKS